MLTDELKKRQLEALKGGRSDELEILRYINAQVQNKEIAKQSKLTDLEVIALLRKLAKENEDSQKAAIEGERKELQDKLIEEIEIIRSFLPSEISDDKLKTAIQAIISENSELYEKNRKALIGICINRLKDQADPKRIMQILQEL